MKLRTYGFKLQKEEFDEPINGRNFSINKPDGGLWCSPTESEWGWKDWCESEDFRTERLTSYTDFELKKSAKILTINSLEDFKKVITDEELSTNPPYPFFKDRRLLNWEKIKERYDAVYLTDRGNSECHLPLTFHNDLNAWDCESLVILRWDAIDESTIKWKGAE